jgi:large subunit ribosomal protein L24
MQKKRHIKKGDTVVVISGASKTKSGRVLEVLTNKDRVIVEGVNIISKHSKATKDNPDGGIVKQEAPIHISNVMLVDPSNGERTRVGYKFDDNGKKVRYAKKSGQEIK